MSLFDFLYRVAAGALAALALLIAGCSSVASVPQADSPRYASAFAYDARTVGGHDLDALTSSPQRAVVMLHVDRPASEVFDFLLAEVDQYDDDIVEVAFDNTGSATPGSRGVGSARLCTFDNGKVLVEPLLVYEPHRFYAYTVDAERSTFGVPIRDVLLFYSFEEPLEGGTLVTVRAHYTPSSFLTGPVVKPVFNRAIRRAFATAADRLGGVLVDPAR
ncbi:MAG: SRPBCC family protein [Bacteroidota bacterium]